MKRTYKNYIGLLKILFIIFVIAMTMLMTRTVYKSRMSYFNLALNSTITWFNLGIAIFVLWLKNHEFKFKKIALSVVLLIWFISNIGISPIITEITNLSRRDYLSYSHYNVKSVEDLLVWYDFMMVTFFVMVGVLNYFISINLIHGVLRRFEKRIINVIFLILTFFFGGIIIYLSRFKHLNIIDFLKFKNFDMIRGALNIRGILLSISFGLFLLVLYWALYYTLRIGVDGGNEE